MRLPAKARVLSVEGAAHSVVPVVNVSLDVEGEDGSIDLYFVVQDAEKLWEKIKAETERARELARAESTRMRAEGEA